ncbi:MAG: cell division protein [Gammaproteobacteria bacterium RBG_16_51_14]|nr:MAG: cell division protein [Gammaproteobacteria bacterium RBG_16_51_14]
MSVLLWRAADLQLLNNDFLRNHGDARSVRVVTIPAHRGVITDRNGEPLAMSTPVHSVWATPRKVLEYPGQLASLAELLGISEKELVQSLKDRIGRDFVYLKRHIDPDLANQVNALNLSGVYLQREYRRYYPAGEVTAHIIGFTNVDDNGQEGLELAYDAWLQGVPGAKRVLKDRLGRVVENIESIRAPEPGKALSLSIDQRVQYLAYRELKAAVQYHQARGGSLVMLDTKTGEVMAMVGQPSYNPNNRNNLKGEYYRNRTVTDVFEPGSTLKPFTIAAALESGQYLPSTTIDTRPGYFRVGGHTIRDIHDYGVIDVTTVIKKSSNVGASKIALSLEPKALWEILSKVGFGQPSGSAFPGESSGSLTSYNNWSEVEHATIAFGYGLSMTPLQLAQAYAVLAAGGIMIPVSFTRLSDPAAGVRVISASVARQVCEMLETVVQDHGTGGRAAVRGYRVAGKTGTVHKSSAGGYSEDRYLSLFAGMAPASDPRIAMVVVIDEPGGSEHFGGQVAAPVFSRVMAGALRLLNIAPDDIPAFSSQVMASTVSPDHTEGLQ